MKNDIKKLKEYPVTNSRAWNDPINNLKLDWNEADEKIPQKLLSKAFKLYKGENTNWYPKLVNHSLLKEISNYTKAETKNIVFGTGSDILHEYIAQCFINRGDKILIISPNYDQFRKTVNLNGAKISFYNFLKKENDLSYKLSLIHI